MMKKILVIILLFLLSCKFNIKKEKPFIIIHKEINYIDYKCRYIYQDKYDVCSVFFEKNEMYKIGDTIK